MKIYKNDEEEDLWNEYGSAYGAIWDILKETFAEHTKSKWALDKAYTHWRGNSYTISATFTRFDEELKDVVMVCCNAEGNRKRETINTSYGKLIRVEYDFWKKEYKPKGDD